MAEPTQTTHERIDKFHAHLDICSQCEKHPFALCPTGAKLLKEAAVGEEEERIRPYLMGLYE